MEWNRLTFFPQEMERILLSKTKSSLYTSSFFSAHKAIKKGEERVTVSIELQRLFFVAGPLHFIFSVLVVAVLRVGLNAGVDQFHYLKGLATFHNFGPVRQGGQLLQVLAMNYHVFVML